MSQISKFAHLCWTKQGKQTGLATLMVTAAYKQLLSFGHILTKVSSLAWLKFLE